MENKLKKKKIPPQVALSLSLSFFQDPIYGGLYLCILLLPILELFPRWSDLSVFLATDLKLKQVLRVGPFSIICFSRFGNKSHHDYYS